MCKIRLLLIIISIICCQLIGCQDYTLMFNDLPGVEGDNCTLENGGEGICKKISECPTRLLEVRKGKRTAFSGGRCGFDHLTEIVCCSNETIPVEGDDCTLDNGVSGTCEKLTKCPSSSEEVEDGEIAPEPTGNCGIDPLNDIVCCPFRRAECGCRLTCNFQRIYDSDNEVSINDLHNGESTYKNEFPFMAALGYATNKTGENASSIIYHCGGTLISDNRVLTAAHCVSNIHGLVPVVVRMGNGNLKDDEGVSVIPISVIIIHPQYRRSKRDYDVAILKLEFRVDFGDEVMPICLQTKSAAEMGITSHTDLIVTGWGSTSFEDDEFSDQLMKTPGLRIVDNEVCNTSFSKFTHRLPHGITDNMICTADPNTTRMSDACGGDSGGPLLLPGYPKWRQIGIAAFGSFCGSTTPGVYISIYPFLDWIEEQVWPETEYRRYLNKNRIK